MSPILHGTDRLTGLHLIQCKVGASWSKGILFYPLSHVVYPMRLLGFAPLNLLIQIQAAPIRSIGLGVVGMNLACTAVINLWARSISWSTHLCQKMPSPMSVPSSCLLLLPLHTVASFSLSNLTPSGSGSRIVRLVYILVLSLFFYGTFAALLAQCERFAHVKDLFRIALGITFMDLTYRETRHGAKVFVE